MTLVRLAVAEEEKEMNLENLHDDLNLSLRVHWFGF